MDIKETVRKWPLLINNYRRGKEFWERVWLPRSFVSNFDRFADLSRKTDNRFQINWLEKSPWLEDATATTSFDRHYIYHTAWAARTVAQINPKQHVDISSSLYFVGILSTFFPVDFYDYRPPELVLDNFNCAHADLTNLHFEDNSLASLSCMHVVEHIGLGRYGDPIDPKADLRAMAELQRVVAPGGNLLFVTPIGRPKVMFNCQRVYSYEQIFEAFADLTLKQFAYIPNDASLGGLVYSPDLRLTKQVDGCGCFWFTKPSTNQ